MLKLSNVGCSSQCVKHFGSGLGLDKMKRILRVHNPGYARKRRSRSDGTGRTINAGFPRCWHCQDGHWPAMTTSIRKSKLAEREGFEPSVGFNHARFPGVCLKPLSHLSA